MSGFDLRNGLAVGAGGLLLLATVGDGGGSVAALAVWHGALAMLLAASFFARWDRVPAAAPTLAWLGFCGLATIGAAWAPYRYLAGLSLLELAWITGFGLLASRIGLRASGAVLDLLRLGAVGHALWSVVQNLQGIDRPASTFLNPNHLGGWAVAILLLNLDRLLEYNVARGERIRSSLALFACVVTVALSGSRGAWLGLAVGGGWLAFRRFGSLNRSVRLGLIAGAMAILAVGLWSQSDRLRESDPFRYNRVRIWSATLNVAAESPWLGVGPGQFPIAAQRFQFPDDSGALRFDRSFSRSHSDLLRLFTDYGIPAGLTALLAIGLLVRHVRRSRREDSTESAEYRGAGHGAVTALIAIGTQALVDNPSEWSAVSLLAAWLCGRAISIPEPVRDLPGGLSVFPRIAAACGLIWVFGVGDVAPVRAHYAVPWGRPSPSRAWDLGLTDAREFCPIRADLWRLQAEHRLAELQRLTPEAYAEARAEIENAIRLSPEDFTHRWALARLESDAARSLFDDPATRARAASAYDRARTLHPTDGRIAIDAGRSAWSLGDFVRARRLTEAALSLEPNSVPAMMLMAELQAAESAGSAGPGEVERWLRQARETHDAHAGSAQGGYARQMLRLDEQWAAAIRARASGAER